VLPKHCEHVFFHLDFFQEFWWFIIPCTPKGKRVFDIVRVAIVASGKNMMA
jgi:hypothetical protein